MGNAHSGYGDRYTVIRDMRWSPLEKIIARQAFDRALQKEFEVVIREAKRRAAEIQQPSDLWNLERRKEIDTRYDYRYSVLPFVFADLISTRRLAEEDLRGLSEEKLAHIRALASHCGLQTEPGKPGQ